MWLLEYSRVSPWDQQASPCKSLRKAEAAGTKSEDLLCQFGVKSCEIAAMTDCVNDRNDRARAHPMKWRGIVIKNPAARSVMWGDEPRAKVTKSEPLQPCAAAPVLY